MTSTAMAMSLRSKKISVLLKDARQAAGRTQKECADLLGVTPYMYSRYENSEKSPSLPELEALAFFLNVPLSHFWGRTAVSASQESQLDHLRRVLDLRRKMIGVQLRKTRMDMDLSLTDLSEKTGLSDYSLRNYENGDPVPLPELEIIVAALGRSVQEFFDVTGPVGQWLHEQQAIAQFLELPTDLQDFVSRPINQPYLLIAQRMSEMSAEKLRNVAEILLEITL